MPTKTKAKAKKTKKTFKAEKKPKVSASPKEIDFHEKKEEKIETHKKYFYAVGKRKASIAQIRIYESRKGDAKITVNEREVGSYFPVTRLQEIVKAPLFSGGKADSLSVSAKVIGGGVSGQAEAVRLGISRALVKMDETLRKPLKDLGFLTRDARIVERKKAGLKKARRAPQWAKR